MGVWILETESKAEPIVKRSVEGGEAESVLAMMCNIFAIYFVFLNIFITFTFCFKEECGRIGFCLRLAEGLPPTLDLPVVLQSR